jgi:hypothetical protein
MDEYRFFGVATSSTEAPSHGKEERKGSPPPRCDALRERRFAGARTVRSAQLDLQGGFWRLNVRKGMARLLVARIFERKLGSSWHSHPACKSSERHEAESAPSATFVSVDARPRQDSSRLGNRCSSLPRAKHVPETGLRSSGPLKSLAVFRILERSA